jgi:Peptidase family M1 domain
MPVRRFVLLPVLALVLPALSVGQQKLPNSNATYQQLRRLLPGGPNLAVQEFVLKRDAATFTFHSGSFALYGEVNGKITGAAFRGSGSLHLVPPTGEERHSLSLLTKQPELDETFSTAVLRFTDATADEIRKAATQQGIASPDMTQAGQQLASALRTKLNWNLDARLLEDVLSPAPGGFFLASINGQKYASKMIFMIDPHGARDVSPEEVELMTWNDNRSGIWAAFHNQDEYHSGIADGNEANDTYTIDHQDLNTTIQKNGELSGVAQSSLRSSVDGLAVVPLELFPSLRVSDVRTADGTPLDFIQENKDDDPDFAVILAKPLKKGEKIDLRVTYAGKDAVVSEGSGNYYLTGGARESWYPSAKVGGLGSYATYHMLFHLPKGIDIVATGNQVSETQDGNQTTTEWTANVPIPVAGFNMGRFQKEEVRLKSGFVVDAYANTDLPDNVRSLLDQVNGSGPQQVDAGSTGMALGTLSTLAMLKPAMAQGEIAVALYSRYFGPLQFTHLAVTQQTPCNYGQSWPMLVYLPICAFWDTTIRHELGLDWDSMYWKVVTPHEVAHQWWGQTVSFRSYRDQWMSEGFADFSASIFLQATNKNNDVFRDFWQEERRSLTEKNAQGFRPIDVGPVTMGYRLENSRSGASVTRDLIYPKGAYILHMLRMMNWNARDGDKWLMATLQDFVETYRQQPATTEDFKAILEKHITPEMDLDGNHRLDWFFNEYVYGTALPHYTFHADMKPDGPGTDAALTIVQSNVDPSFKMLVPLYAQLKDGRVIRLGEITLLGNTTFQKELRLGEMPSPIARLMINYYNDVLCTQE